MPQFPVKTALLTPPGRAAVAVIGLWGDDVVHLIDQVFTSTTGKSLVDLSTQRAPEKQIFYGRWLATGEDVVVTQCDDRWEIHCHGGSFAPQKVLDSLFQSGNVELVSSPSAARRIFKTCWKAEIQTLLSQSSTDRAAQWLLRMLQLADTFAERLRAELIADTARFELTLTQMLELAEFGLHLTIPRSVVFCGQPNVGKSSLINALIGFERSIVHQQPGTTRDVVTSLSAIDGWPVEFKDTAGLRDTTNLIEQTGIERARQVIETADLVIAVFDVSDKWHATSDQQIRDLRPQIVVGNKVDLLTDTSTQVQSFNDSVTKSWQVSNERNRDDYQNYDASIIMTSTVTQHNVNELIDQIANSLVPRLPPLDLLIPVSETQVDRIESWLQQLQRGERQDILRQIEEVFFETANER